MRNLFVLLVAASAAFLPLASIADDTTPLEWQPPLEGVVRDAKAAITIARAIWFSIHPDFEKNQEVVEFWKYNLEAELKGDVWIVETKSSKADLDGGVGFLISKKDGRIIKLYGWQ